MMKTKSWTQSVRRVVARLPQTFKTADVYRYERGLQRARPENQNVRAKIRQQLQVLRDAGELTQPVRGQWNKT